MASPHRGDQPCAAVTLHYTLSSLANIKSHQPLSFLARLAPCMEQQHYSLQIIREKKDLFSNPRNFFQVLSCEI